LKEQFFEKRLTARVFGDAARAWKFWRSAARTLAIKTLTLFRDEMECPLKTEILELQNLPLSQMGAAGSVAQAVRNRPAQ
jgi:hypothetical protein